jgi:hypothetical protein
MDKYVQKGELFIISHNLSYFLGQHHFLPYLFANIPFKFCLKGSEFTKMMMKIINYPLNFEKFVINEALFNQSLNKYLW